MSAPSKLSGSVGPISAIEPMISASRAGGKHTPSDLGAPRRGHLNPNQVNARLNACPYTETLRIQPEFAEPGCWARSPSQSHLRWRSGTARFFGLPRRGAGADDDGPTTLKRAIWKASATGIGEPGTREPVVLRSSWAASRSVSSSELRQGCVPIESWITRAP